MFDAAAIAAFRAHALALYPEEACGIITPGGFEPVPNLAETRSGPGAQFVMPAETALGDILAILHSHPDGPAHPSAADMQGQIDSAVPWGIAVTLPDFVSEVVFWGPGVPIPPLIGREFRHGPSGTDGKGDCYALVKDWFQLERGIALPEVPRDDMWWEGGKNLYLDLFEPLGFRCIGLDEVRPGDGFLIAIRSPVPNHAGIVLDHGLMLHHLPTRLSKTEPVGNWVKLAHCWLRHEGPA
jgi:cell wall-associated NlpC family hydrolase